MKRISVLICLLVVFGGFSVLAQDDENSESISASAGLDSSRNNRFLIYPGFGVGLIRNELAPAFHINIGFNHRDRYEGNINTSSFFFFEKGDNSKYNIHRNTFLNAEFLLNFSPLSKSLRNWNGLGVGYLIESRGGYFSETTMMLYYKRKLRLFSITPGLIFDDNFKDVWPVISIRL